MKIPKRWVAFLTKVSRALAYQYDILEANGETDEGEASHADFCFYQRYFTFVPSTLGIFIHILLEKYILLHRAERKFKRELKTIVLVPRPQF